MFTHRDSTNTATQPQIDSLKIVVEVDPGPDTSTIGEYTDTQTPWAIERTSGEYVSLLPDDFEMPERGREYRFFVPYAGGEKPGNADYQQYGKQDFQRMESLSRGDWCYVGVYAKAVVSRPCGQGCRRLETFTSGGLWGIESDSDKPYLKSVMQEELANLTEHLEAFNVDTSNIAELGAAAIESPL